MTATAGTVGQWHALIVGYGRHRRPVAPSNCRLWPSPQASGTLQWTVMADTAGQWHALIVDYGRHRRDSGPRSNWLLWPTPQARASFGQWWPRVDFAAPRKAESLLSFLRLEVRLLTAVNAALCSGTQRTQPRRAFVTRTLLFNNSYPPFFSNLTRTLLF